MMKVSSIILAVVLPARANRATTESNQ